jgi:hypothetical protein
MQKNIRNQNTFHFSNNPSTSLYWGFNLAELPNWLAEHTGTEMGELKNDIQTTIAASYRTMWGSIINIFLWTNSETNF